METDWGRTPPDLQLALASEAIKRARRIVGAQAQMLADQIDRGSLPSFDGPDALRLLAMILNQDDPADEHIPSYQPAPQLAQAMAY